jgi:hypothetical protein
MKFSKKELGFILYNNRSTHLVTNFIDKNQNPFRLTNIENIFKESKSKFINSNKMVEIPISDLNLESDDVVFTKEDLSSLTNEFLSYTGKFNKKEFDFLKKRGIDKNIIEKWNLFGLSNIKDDRKLEIIGAKVHPIVSKVLIDGIEGGGIIFPLFNNGLLENCAIRKISLENTDKASLKYSLSCPDVPVWKSDNIQPGDEIWLTEGLFDMFALDNIGLKSVSCSSAMWSGIQLYQIIMLRPSKINIFSDNDEVGLRTSAILNDFFKSYGLLSDIFISNESKDASEHFFERKLGISDLELIDIKPDSLIKNDNSFNFLNHIKNRKY